MTTEGKRITKPFTHEIYLPSEYIKMARKQIIKELVSTNIQFAFKCLEHGLDVKTLACKN